MCSNETISSFEMRTKDPIRELVFSYIDSLGKYFDLLDQARQLIKKDRSLQRQTLEDYIFSIMEDFIDVGDSITLLVADSFQKKSKKKDKQSNDQVKLTP